MDFCDWANVAAHELAHALGFSSGYLPFAMHSQYGLFVGSHTKREWDKYSSIQSYPPLEFIDSDHWSEQCFARELMLPHLASRTRVRRRALLSRITLAVFADIGYQVNYKCADPKVPLFGACRKSTRKIRRSQKLRQFCRRYKEAWPRRLGSPKYFTGTKRRFQVLRYQWLMACTSRRKAIRRWMRRSRKQARVCRKHLAQMPVVLARISKTN